MQDGQLCLLSPGEGGGQYSILRGGKQKGRLVGVVECGTSRVKGGEGGAREHCSFFFFYCTLLKS